MVASLKPGFEDETGPAGKNTHRLAESVTDLVQNGQMIPSSSSPQGIGPASAPNAWSERLAAYRWERQAIGRSRATVFRLVASGRPDLFVKAEPSGIFCEIIGEAARLRWLITLGVACPEVLGLEASAGWHWLLMTAVHSIDLATRHDLLPTEVIDLAVSALKMLHAYPVEGCPFDHRLARRLALARSRLSAGLIDPRNFADEHLGRSPEELMEDLLANRPGGADLVLAHGDACLPNFMTEGSAFAGFVDCARLGIADRYQDLALAGWSIGFNLGVDWIEPFYRAYELTDPDRQKLQFYRTLDEFF